MAMALTFNSRRAVQKLLGRGLSEPAADGIVEVVEEATSPLVTRDMLRADMYRALWTFGMGIVAANAGVAVAVVTLAQAFD